MPFSEKLINLRKQRDMSQEDLALKIFVSRQAVSRWESGYTLPDAENLLKISRLFNVTIDYLLDNEKDLKVNKSKTEEKNNKIRIVAGTALAIFGAVGALIMGIIGSVRNDVIYGDAYFEETRGLLAFLEIYNLEWLFVLCFVILSAGIIALLYPKMKPYIFKKD